MAGQMKKLSQEEEVLKMLREEGFRELSQKELLEKRYSSLTAMPDCFQAPKRVRKAQRLINQEQQTKIQGK
jgi:hypothetical protein